MPQHPSKAPAPPLLRRVSPWASVLCFFDELLAHIKQKSVRAMEKSTEYPMGSGFFYMAAMVLKTRGENLRAKELNAKRAGGMPSLAPYKRAAPDLS